MAKRLDLRNIGAYRKAQGLNQHDFWQRYGVTQSGGSRYESGRPLPTHVAALVWLHDAGKIDDRTLSAALKAGHNGHR